MHRLGRKFFARDTITVAKEMLGKYIVRRAEQDKIAGKIVEVEVYIGPADKASHAYKGKRTKRNEAEFKIGGHIYIYMVYGMYWQFNISTSGEGTPECVLIRALEPVLSTEPKVVEGKTLASFGAGFDQKIRKLSNGPGKLCNYLKVDKSFYGIDMAESKDIWLEDRGNDVKKDDIVCAPRVGIDYAGKYWVRRKWRFYIKNNSFVSKV